MFDLSVFNKLPQVKILVVGDVMLDRYWTGDSSRISPEAPVPVVKIGELDDKVGGAANVARNIAHLDGQVSLLGIIGNDENGERLESLLAKENIESALIKQNEQPTITKLRVISRQQQVVRLDFEQAFSLQHADALQQAFEQEVTNFDFVLFSDYNKGSLARITPMIKHARALDKIVLIDPKSKDLSDYAGANVITPNKTEFVAAGGLVDTEQAIWQSAQAIMEKTGIESILLTRSEQGMSAITPTEKVDMPAQVLEVSDVTGAGDTVIATLAMMMAAGLELADAAKVANLAAGIVVAKLGAATVSPEELYRAVNKSLFASKQAHYQTPFEEVLQHIEFARQSGEKIVFTNGCFDILHAGHVHYLEQAKALGDRLVVGLNTDASISRLKGPDRPINPLHERATVITGLASVDWVIPFGEQNGNEFDDTPYDVIKQVKPDVLVKGVVDRLRELGASNVIENPGKEEDIVFAVPAELR